MPLNPEFKRHLVDAGQSLSKEELVDWVVKLIETYFDKIEPNPAEGERITGRRSSDRA